jgi:hypothetical protein
LCIVRIEIDLTDSQLDALAQVLALTTSRAFADTAAGNGIVNPGTATDGGGIYNDGRYGTAAVTLTNSTVTGNTAAGNGGIDGRGYAAAEGGGMFNDGAPGVPGTRTTTITLNRSAIVAGDAAGYQGCGIFSVAGSEVGLINCRPRLGGNVRGNTPDDIFDQDSQNAPPEGVRDDGYSDSRLSPSLSVQNMAWPSPAIPLAPAPDSRQYPPGLTQVPSLDNEYHSDEPT